MKKEQFDREFLSKALILRLFKEIPDADCEQKIDLVNNYTKTIKKSFEEEVFRIRYNNEIGFIYWKAQRYALAIEYWEKSINELKPQDCPFLYFHIVSLLIRCNRHINEYSESFRWVDKAFHNIYILESSLMKLAILGEYVDLLMDTNVQFDYDQKIIIQIIDDFGFPEQLTNPVETINSMRQTNKFWNKKLMEIELMDKSFQSDAYKQYMKDCPVTWYRDYVQESVKNGR